MTVKILSTFVGIWMAFALIGGMMDGVILGGQDTSGAGEHTGDAEAFEKAGQAPISSEETGFLSGIRRWFSASFGFLEGWATMLTLNFSFFTGSWAPFGWFVRGILGLPIIAMLLIQVFGR